MRGLFCVTGAWVAVSLGVVVTAHADIGSLKGASIPPVKDRISGESLIPHFVKDKRAAIRLGKTLFWDRQAGSDGQACASCHFHAGADVRLKNSLNAGPNGTFNTGNAGAPNYSVRAQDFPIRNDDRMSSQGVFPSLFEHIVEGAAEEACTIEYADPLGFHVEGINVRRVEPRNTPTMINAAFQLRTFWDGRANNIFNGVDPFGRRNKKARIHYANSPTDKWKQRRIELENSHLASQAAGPPGSNFEMSCAGRAFHHLGKKLLSLQPLAMQRVATDDSVLGNLADRSGNGLVVTYDALIRAAFPNKFWNSQRTDDRGFTLMQRNFALFWSLSIQLYQQTLISDDSPFDNNRLSSAASRGEQVFRGAGKCINCHDTAMFSKASSQHLIDERQEEGLVERMSMGREVHPYGVKASGAVKQGKGKPLAQLSLSASGSPHRVGEGGSGSASGTVKINFMKKKSQPCEFNVTTFELGLDDDNRTRDVRVTGDGSCGTVAVTVIEGSNKVRIEHGNVVISGTITGGVETRQPAVYDNGFYNIGVRPTAEDLGVGGVDPFGNPLSFSRQYISLLLGRSVPDSFRIDECTFELRFDPDVDVFFFPGGFDSVSCSDGSTTHKPSNNSANRAAILNLRVAVDGAMKVPTLRNVELNGPYFHNGGHATLEQVVDFYNRGGDFSNGLNKDPDIRPLGLSSGQRSDLVAFLKSLTDDRVRCKRAPFDHPELQLPNGHPGDHAHVVDSDGDLQADDNLRVINAVGARGVATCLGPFAP